MSTSNLLIVLLLTIVGTSVAKQLPVRIPAGEYFICVPDHWTCFGMDRFPTMGVYRQVLFHPPWFIKLPEAPRNAYVFSNGDTFHKFILSYANNDTTAFQLDCPSCQNAFHGSAVSMLDGGLVYGSDPIELQAFKFKKDKAHEFRIRRKEKVFGLSHWLSSSRPYRRFKFNVLFSQAFRFVKAEHLGDITNYPLASETNYEASYKSILSD